jgi:uncharacterized membrane protein YuzA (DUF378 family)
MGKMNVLDWIAIVLLIVGGLNWGLVGVFDWNLVQAIFGIGLLTKIVYGLVGVSALFSIWSLYKATK